MMIESKVSTYLLLLLIMYVFLISIDCYKLTLLNNNNNNRKMMRINTNVIGQTTTLSSPTEIMSLKDLKDFYYNKKMVSKLNEVPLSNITTSEWSIFTEINNIFEDKSIDKIMSILIEQNEIDKKSNSIIKIDKGTTNSIDILNELYELKGDYEFHLNVYRRNIALRVQNYYYYCYFFNFILHL